MRETSQARRTTRETNPARYAKLWLIALVAVGVLMLAACDSGPSGKVSTAGSPGPGNANATTTAAGDTPTIPADTPTTTPISGPGGQVGSSQFCSQQPSVSVQLPASIPAYPHAQLRLSQADGGNSIYGLCTSDAVNTAIQFYVGQLPAKGWQQLQQNNNDPVQQVTAKRSGNNVTITVYPDAVVANETDIIIQLTAA